MPEGAGRVEGGAAEVPLANTYLDRWMEEITAAEAGDLQKIIDLAEWCKNSGGSCDLICLLENRGRAVEQMTVREIAEMIYLDKKYFTLISQRGLDVYIPTYLKG